MWVSQEEERNKTKQKEGKGISKGGVDEEEER